MVTFINSYLSDKTSSKNCLVDLHKVMMEKERVEEVFLDTYNFLIFTPVATAIINILT